MFTSRRQHLRRARAGAGVLLGVFSAALGARGAVPLGFLLWDVARLALTSRGGPFACIRCIDLAIIITLSRYIANEYLILMHL